MDRLYDSELKVMEIIWERGPLPAREISQIAAETIGWNKNTTYTVIRKLVEKNCLQRNEPNFTCSPLISREAVQRAERESLIDKLYDGSKKAFLSAFLRDEDLTEQELAELKAMIEKR